jgi:hypothetical protein
MDVSDAQTLEFGKISADNLRLAANSMYFVSQSKFDGISRDECRTLTSDDRHVVLTPQGRR